jgi:hypothetical protein
MIDPLDDNLDARLRAAFAPPPAADLAAVARRAAAEHAPRRPWWWLVVAAAAAILVGAALWLRPVRGPEGHDGAQLGALWAAAFEQAETRGFGACCDNAVDAGAVCQQRFAVKLAIGGGIALQGCYCGLPTGGCVALLAQTRDGPAGVFVLPRDQDPRPRLPAGCPLELARRELGPVVLYAVSRTASARWLEQFRLAP